MRICRFDDNRVGIVEGEDVIDVTSVTEHLPKSGWPYPRGDAFIASLDRLRPELERLAATGERKSLSEVRLLSPVANPGKLIAAPVNYRLHLEESREDAGIHFGSHVKTIQECGVFLKATLKRANGTEVSALRIDGSGMAAEQHTQVELNGFILDGSDSGAPATLPAGDYTLSLDGNVAVGTCNQSNTTVMQSVRLQWIGVPV